MATNFTNRKASQTLAGQAALVTLNSSDAANMYLLRAGQLCTNQSSGKTGTVNKINVYGNSFTISPIQPNMNFSSASVYGYLASGEVVSVNT